jgi:CDP-glycerol glycerophosphotransferase (TagB/SpsB family)
MHIDSIVEAPTLAQQRVHKEVNEIIANNKESLNDKLKQEKKEIAHILKDSPVKDLRKAIGVNDKFVFISELFRGDEAMYERSIKTINTFHILPEAEYWMNRELKVKLGWNDTNETVQHFYQLVRRRFS